MVIFKHIWKLLRSVPDPEIPVISVVELGVIRKVSYEDNNYKICITPNIFWMSSCQNIYR